MKETGVILTGGGSGGHLFPLNSVINELKGRGVTTLYVGRDHSLERNILVAVDEFYGIATGKLRRNWSIRVALLNIVDVFRIIGGFLESYVVIRRILKKYPRTVIFSSGGFVSVPPLLSAFINKIPIIIHEQTAQAGLANRIAAMIADTICISFPESGHLFKEKKNSLYRFPITREFLQEISYEEGRGSENQENNFQSEAPYSF